MLKDLLKTSDLAPDDIQLLLELASSYKQRPHRSHSLLQNETVVLYFNKPSTRTRISFETAIARLGGTPIPVRPEDLQLGRGETIEDTAQVVSRYARAVTNPHVQRRGRSAIRLGGNHSRDQRAHRPASSLSEYRGYVDAPAER